MRELGRSWVVRAVALAAVLCGTPLAAVYYQAAMRDPDMWWHLRVGEWIAQGHGFPHTALFSRFADVRPWAAYSWLFELLMSVVYRAFHLPSLPVLHFILLIVFATLLFLALREATQSFWRAL